MDIQITVTVTNQQRDAIQAQLARMGGHETPAQLVTRLTQKMINGWVLNMKQELRQKNAPAMQDMVDQIADNPDRDQILAGMGWRFVDGVLQRVP